MLRHLKKWFKRKKGNPFPLAQSAKPKTPPKPKPKQTDVKDENIIFQRTLIRTPFGRIVTEDDDTLDEDDVQGFFDIVNNFEKNGSSQVVKVKYLVNERTAQEV